MSAKIREEFEKAFEERYGYGLDQAPEALWAVQWPLKWLTRSTCGECHDDSTVSIGFIRRRLKELQ